MAEVLNKIKKRETMAKKINVNELESIYEADIKRFPLKTTEIQSNKKLY